MPNSFLLKASRVWGHQYKGIKVVSKCPICNSRYKDDQARVIEEKGDAHLIHIECQKCLSNVVALVVKAGVGVSSMGMVTDLTAPDVEKFKNNGSVTANDCIEAHNLLAADHNQLIEYVVFHKS